MLNSLTWAFVLVSILFTDTDAPPVEEGTKPETSFGHLGVKGWQEVQRQSGRGFIQLSVFSQANLLLHSKHRTGLSSWSAVFSEHSQDKVPVETRWK